MSIIKVIILSTLTLFIIQAHADMAEELRDELDLIEQESQNLRVYPPANKTSSKMMSTSKIGQSSVKPEILDIESEFKDEEVRLNRAAPVRRKKSKADIFEKQEQDQDLDEI